MKTGTYWAKLAGYKEVHIIEIFVRNLEPGSQVYQTRRMKENPYTNKIIPVSRFWQLL